MNVPLFRYVQFVIVMQQRSNPPNVVTLLRIMTLKTAVNIIGYFVRGY